MASFFLVFLYLASLGLLCLYGLHTYLMVFWYGRHHKACSSERRWSASHSRPRVTIQLPVFNEEYVVERLIDSVIRMEYPKRLKQIQVLDDSTDGTLALTKAAVAKYRRQGYDISLCHRADRKGHKGGALREALPEAKGEFVAIFDADFVPAKDFLTATLPVFDENPRIGMVQTRWGHLNAESSFLTRAQALGVDGHFMVDQVARAGRNLFMNFNGTAGIWRKECILDAGNWQDDTLTEDFDLSYRAELKGWKFRYLKDVVNPSELPVRMSAYKSQQFRWAKGSLQTAGKLLLRILRSKESVLTKCEAVIHLTYYSFHPLILFNILLTLPILGCEALFRNQALLTTVFSVLTVGTLGPVFFYAFSQYAIYGRKGFRRSLWVPLMVVVGTGIAVNNTRAFLEALFGHQSEFIRTPKIGVRKKAEGRGRMNYAATRSSLIVMGFELLFAGYCVLVILRAVSLGRFFIIPFFVLYLAAFLYVFLAGVEEFLSAYRRRTVFS